MGSVAKGLRMRETARTPHVEMTLLDLDLHGLLVVDVAFDLKAQKVSSSFVQSTNQMHGQLRQRRREMLETSPWVPGFHRRCRRDSPVPSCRGARSSRSSGPSGSPTRPSWTATSRRGWSCTPRTTGPRVSGGERCSVKGTWGTFCRLEKVVKDKIRLKITNSTKQSSTVLNCSE